MLLVFSAVKRLLKHSMKKNCRGKAKKEFRIEKVIKRKGDRLYIYIHEHSSGAQDAQALRKLGHLKKTWALRHSGTRTLRHSKGTWTLRHSDTGEIGYSKHSRYFI